MRTVQQQAAIDTVVDAAVRVSQGKQAQHFCLRARAGSGKTSTSLDIIHAVMKACPSSEITICAFGNKAAAELKAKLAPSEYDWKQVQASTVHSMGFGLVRFHYKLGKDDVNPDKVRDIIRLQNGAVYAEHEGSIKDLVDKAKLEGFGFFADVQIGDIGAWYELAERYQINGFDDTSELDNVIEAAQHVYKLSLADTRTIDYSDMILFPLIKNIRVKFTRDLLIVDEAQDTGRARQALIKKFLKSNGILIVVGDDKQAIFAFAGAQTNALEQLISEFDMRILPLTVCFRCPKAVVRLAQTLVPDIEHAEKAIEGEVVKLQKLPDAPERTDAVLCRNTAPLIAAAYDFLRRGVACKVEGREIGSNLLRLVNRWKRVSTIDAWLGNLEEYRQREIQKARAKGKNAEQKIEEINDRCDTLVHLANVCIDNQKASLDDLRNFINSMFADDVKSQGMLTLATYHKSKGREWKNVYLVEHAKRCPSPMAKTDDAKEQERNLAYVAFTRAEERLAFVN